MPRIVFRSMLLFATLVTALQLNLAVADAADGRRACQNCRQYTYGQPDLFYNYWVPPNCGGVGAELYLAPYPVPPLVGHTYITYQPLMPHEFLYHHHRTYHRYYNEGRGLTRAHVMWYPAYPKFVSDIVGAVRLAR